MQDFVYRKDLRPQRRGAINAIFGGENVRSALENRLSTSFRSIPFLPNYGVNLKEYQNSVMTEDNRTRIRNEVQTQILRDPRVKAIRSITVNHRSNGLLFIQVSIVLIGTDEVVDLGVDV